MVKGTIYPRVRAFDALPLSLFLKKNQDFVCLNLKLFYRFLLTLLSLFGFRCVLHGW